MSDVRLPPGTSVCGCASCGEIFTGTWGFDEHWRNEHQGPEAAGLVVKRRTEWGAVVWGSEVRAGREVPWNGLAGGAVGVEGGGLVGGGG